MKKTGVVNLPLHSGRCPKWLFPRMVELSGALSEIIIEEYGTQAYLERLSNPYFFQAFGCVVGFDWHSSGLTTTLCGALKLGLESNTGVIALGGKGKTSKKTPDEIKASQEIFNFSERKIQELVYASRMSAKVDNSLVQDGYQLYHHTFFLNERGDWSVVQQGLGMHGYARRYHWISGFENFMIEPQSAIVGEPALDVLNLSSKEHQEIQEVSVDLVKDHPGHLKRYIAAHRGDMQKTLSEYGAIPQYTLPSRHDLTLTDLGNFNALLEAYEQKPKDYEELVGMKGIGAKTLRALALISSLVHGTELSWKDPAKYSFAHGGKDGIPYPVDKENYDQNIEILRNALQDVKVDDRRKLHALRRLQWLVR